MDKIVYLNGAFVPEAQALVPVTERGFFGGDGVYEVTRTFGHTLFRLDAHLDRLYRSLAYVRIDPGLDREALREVTLETLNRNLGRLSDKDEVSVWHVISRGDSAMNRPSRPIVAVFCVEVDFDHFAADYLTGIRLATPGIRRTPPSSIDPKAKVTSRMNQVQAALEIGRANPGAVPLLLDAAGNIAETNTGNFFFVADGRLCTPAARNVLGGVTRATVIALAMELGLDVVEGDFTPYDVYAADEAFITSTSPSIMPVQSLNGAQIGNARHADLPGPVTLKLIKAFSRLAGVDFVAQAISHLGDNRARELLAAWDARLCQDA